MNLDDFEAFEILERSYSPNAVVGITDDGRRVFITAPVPALGKQLGDKIALVIKETLERECNMKVATLFEEAEPSMVECPHCKEFQTHGFPMSGKLYCRSCGELLDELIA